MNNFKFIPTYRLKEILSENYCRGVNGEDYEPYREELEDILREREMKNMETEIDKSIGEYNER